MNGSRALAWSRLALGTTLVAAPGMAVRLWFGEDHAGMRVALRSIGARDVALAAGLLTTDDPAPWLWAGAAVDLIDALGSAREIGPVPARTLAPGTALAMLFLAVGVREARRRGR